MVWYLHLNLVVLINTQRILQGSTYRHIRSCLLNNFLSFEDSSVVVTCLSFDSEEMFVQLWLSAQYKIFVLTVLALDFGS